MSEDLAQSPQSIENAQPATQVVTSQRKVNKKSKRAGSALVRFITWLIVVVVVIVAALFVSAWIAGFRNAAGFPILFNDGGYQGMIDWIRANVR